jgi:hypothetical protein
MNLRYEYTGHIISGLLFKIKTDLPALLKAHFWRTPKQVSRTQESLPPPL